MSGKKGGYVERGGGETGKQGLWFNERLRGGVVSSREEEPEMEEWTVLIRALRCLCVEQDARASGENEGNFGLGSREGTFL